MEGYLTVKQFAEKYGKHPYTIRAWIKMGRLKAYRPGGLRGQILIASGAFEEMMQKSQVGGIS